jgi:hypothetical protein
LREAIRGRRGLLATVAVGGELRVGVPIRLETADPAGGPREA